MSELESQDLVARNQLKVELFELLGGVIGALVALLVGVVATSDTTWWVAAAAIGFFVGSIVGEFWGASKAKRSGA